MLKIRLTRRGKRNRPFFRIVVAQSQAPVKGRFIEILGFLDPLKKEVKLKKERIKYWLSKGAQASPTVHNLLVQKEIISSPKIKKFAPKKKKKSGEKKEEPKVPKEKPKEEEKSKEEKPPKEPREAPKSEKESAKIAKPQIKEKKKKVEKTKEKRTKVKPLPTQ